MNIWRILISLAVAILTTLFFTALLDGPRPATAPNADPKEPSFFSVCQEAVDLAENGRLEDAIATGTKALRIGEKNLGKDQLVTPEALDRWANTIERWHVALN